MSHLSPVTFHGDTIFCIDYQNQPYTPMRPIVENMGLVWAAQSVKLNANKERWSVSMIETVAQDAGQKIRPGIMPGLLKSILCPMTS